MKKILLSICFMFLITFIPNVNAEDNILVPFFGDSNTSNISSSNSFNIPSDYIKVGDGVIVSVLSCNPSDATSENGIVTYSRDKCTDDNLTISWNSSDSSVASVTDGTIMFLKEGSAVITASSDGYSPVTLNITLTESKEDASTSTSDEGIPNLEDEEDVLVEKNNKTKEKTEYVPKNSYVGKQTESNPKTGISDVLMYIVPILVIGGSIITLKRKCII